VNVIEPLGVPLVADVPGVGAGLQDHPVINGRVPLAHPAPPAARHTTALVRFSSSAAAPGGAPAGPDTFNDLYFVAVEHGTDPRVKLPRPRTRPLPHLPQAVAPPLTVPWDSSMSCFLKSTLEALCEYAPVILCSFLTSRKICSATTVTSSAWQQVF
jgi:hypothetical protein